MAAFLRPAANSIGLSDRLSALPRTGLPLHAPATVHWSAHQVPFIEAASDHDLAVALGVVHVHLRWTQMELMRHVAQGRLSELLGPFGVRFDRVLRTIYFGRAAPAIAAAMPDETRAWVEAFVDGINHAVQHLPQTPPEFTLLGLRRVPWSVSDVITLGRLAAADVTWAVWLALLPHRGSVEVARLWRSLIGAEAPFDLASEQTTDSGKLRSLLLRFTRQGSNSCAIAPSRSENGGAWIASDTHLPALLPNLWLIAGYRSPSFHAAGLMVPGIPALLLGRNPQIAWGGTNLHATSSDLFDVSALPADAFHTRRESLRVRFRGTRQVAIRETEFGPVISDLPQLRKSGGSYALRWMGHTASDEITALLAMNQARDWTQFRAALELIGVPGQNMIYADAGGHIGKAMAAHLPARPPDPPPSLVLPLDQAAHWQRVVRSSGLPGTFDPPDGFVASANNRPPRADVLIGHFFSADHRIDRLRQLLSRRNIGFNELSALQRDVVLLAAVPMRDRLVALLRGESGAGAARLAKVLARWNGQYEAQSAGSLAFELLLYHVGIALHGRRTLRLYSGSWNTRGLLFAQLDQLPKERVSRALRYAIPRVLRGLRRFGTWGRMHRLEPRHVMASIPLLGHVYRFGEWAADGGSDTVMKTAHALTDKRHHAALASTARHISDLADMDANWFVLLGGQDGWLGSTTLVDQTRLWREGAYIRVPLRPESVRAAFTVRTELSP